MTSTESILHNAALPFAILDENKSFLDFSKTWLDQFGLTDDIEGKSFFSLMPELPDELELDIDYCLEGIEKRSDTKRKVLKNGDYVWYDWKINNISCKNDSSTCILIILEDVTHRRREEDLMMRSQEVARIGGWEVDFVRNTIYWSKITKEIHEVPQDYVPDLDKGISFYKEGHSRETISKLVQECREKGKSWDTELQIVTAKGKEVWVRAIGEPELLDGKCVRIVGTFQDIDRRKKTELEFKKLSDRLSIATKTAGIGIWEFDIPNNQLFWDDNMYRLYGIKKNDFKGVYEAWEACVHPDDGEITALEVNDAIAGIRNFDTIFRVRWPNGEARWIRAEATVIRDKDGNPSKMIGINEDITALKVTQLQLLKSEESLQSTLENSSVGMALVATNGKFINVNQSLCKSIGYRKDALLNMRFQDITHPDDLENDLSLLKELIHGKRSTYQIEKKYIHKNGNFVHTILTVTAARGIDGDITHFISQIVDISERIKAEDKLKGLLELSSNQNNSLLNFAHIVSHNLRSHAANLTMINGFLNDETLGESERSDSLTMLGRATSGLNETISHLNEVVQVKLRTDENLKSVHLNYIVQKVLMDLQAIIDKDNIRIEVDVPKELQVKGVLAYLESVVLNLVSNAIKYRDPKKKDNFVSITAFEKGQTIMLKVADNGLGIDLEKHGQKLFGMYKVFHGNKDARGIGLFITKNQIESMGGSISVESIPLKGTTFCVTFVKD
ncbi:PAS domain S-box protein [Allomuricauda sp. ARW1Y1]|jgi:PAS domain S-box-containing protein|uniref:PAS domain-containing sensor histidine kinase n=1 Tax=Allomuricauda sp. ARW1Y1 TaxID=2663843 RepID=UPI0015CC8861|nr:PAS domain S-box protein [Muricauda sp. ARW1Y1]NYJ27948.1 PAS domain S-box-containing protein [Muricauda sp. ARW1Y1]